MKYNNKSSYGTVDRRTVLDLSDDVAHVMLGGGWRIPTDEEWAELKENCTWKWTTQGGVKGYKVTGKKSDYTGKSIFLPAAGWRDNSLGVSGSGAYGWYWSSSLNTDNPSTADHVLFYSARILRTDAPRYKGLSVRPVTK